MSKITPILQFARIIGPENYSQVRNFTKFIKSGSTGKAVLHLETTPKMADEYIRQAEALISKEAAKRGLMTGITPDISKTYNEAKALMPGLYADTNKGILDVVLERLGLKSGSLTAKGVTKNSEGKVISSFKTKILGNSEGIRGSVSSKVNDGSILFSMDGTVLKHGAKSYNAEDFLKAAKLKSRNGVASINIPRTKSGGVTAKYKLSMDEKLADKMIEQQSCGDIESFKELASFVDDVKKM